MKVSSVVTQFFVSSEEDTFSENAIAVDFVALSDRIATAVEESGRHIDNEDANEDVHE